MKVAFFLLNENKLGGRIPDAVDALVNIKDFEIGRNRLHGVIPRALCSLANVGTVVLNSNRLSGPIPDAVSAMLKARRMELSFNSLAGCVPEGFGSMNALEQLFLMQNVFSSTLPDSMHLAVQMSHLILSYNKLQGSIPEALGHLTYLRMSCNNLSGPLLDALFRENMVRFIVPYNTLSGTLPDAISKVLRIVQLFVHNNKLSGTLPDGLLRRKLSGKAAFAASDNQLRGCIWSASPFETFIVNGNQLTGSLPPFLPTMMVWVASGNMLEGTIPMSAGTLTKLRTLEVSGRPSRTQGLQGPLPQGLSRDRALVHLLASNQEFEGITPPFSSTLEMLDLYNNRLKVFSEMPLKHASSSSSSIARSHILMHNNYLSCPVPPCGNVSAGSRHPGPHQCFIK